MASKVVGRLTYCYGHVRLSFIISSTFTMSLWVNWEVQRFESVFGIEKLGIDKVRVVGYGAKV